MGTTLDRDEAQAQTCSSRSENTFMQGWSQQRASRACNQCFQVDNSGRQKGRSPQVPQEFRVVMFELYTC